MLQYAIWKNGLAGMLIVISVLLARIVRRKNIRAKIYQIIIMFVISSYVGLGISACGMKTPTVSGSITQTTMSTTTPGSAEFDATEEITPTAINQATAVITDTVIEENSIVMEKCIEGIVALGEDINISGSIVLYINNGSTYNLILFEPETNKTTEITPYYFENTTHILFLNGVSVSPDGSYLAYQTSYFAGEEYIGNKINIINADNEKITEIDNIYTTQDFEWLRNDVLLIPTVQEDNPLILAEIPSGNQKYIFPILGSEFYDSDYISSWLFYGLTKNVFNSDLSRVVYPAHEKSSPIIKMRNMENNSDILTIPTNIGWGSSPVWFPDGNYFAIAAADNRPASEYYIYIVNRDGEIVFQTDKSSTIMLETIYSMSWSPNSKYLAYHYVIGESSARTHYLGILDFKETKITTYCTPDVYLSTPYWSPDNQYLLYPSQTPDSDEMKSYVLNIETGQNYLVMDGYYPGGWMK